MTPALDPPAHPASRPAVSRMHAEASARPPEAVPFAAALLVGVALGVVFAQSEVASWFRIQEMFRFQSVHLYGTIASAIATAGVSTALLRRADVRRRTGGPLADAPKVWGDRRGVRYWLGGTVFGLGWGLLGACPGPIYALIGGGATVFVAALAAALAGARLYGALRHRLPH